MPYPWDARPDFLHFLGESNALACARHAAEIRKLNGPLTLPPTRGAKEKYYIAEVQKHELCRSLQGRGSSAVVKNPTFIKRFRGTVLAAAPGIRSLKSLEADMEKLQQWRRKQEGKLGYILLWALGVPIPVLFVIFLLRGCN
jgi:hypothetical protein